MLKTFKNIVISYMFLSFYFWNIDHVELRNMKFIDSIDQADPILGFQFWNNLVIDGLIIHNYTANDFPFAPILYLEKLPMSSITINK